MHIKTDMVEGKGLSAELVCVYVRTSRKFYVQWIHMARFLLSQ